MPARIFASDQQQEILGLYPKLSARKIARRFNVDHKVITRILHRNGVGIEHNKTVCRCGKPTVARGLCKLHLGMAKAKSEKTRRSRMKENGTAFVAPIQSKLHSVASMTGDFIGVETEYF